MQLVVVAAAEEMEDLTLERSVRARKEEEEPFQRHQDSWRPKGRRTDHQEIEALFGQAVKKDWQLLEASPGAEVPEAGEIQEETGYRELQADFERLKTVIGAIGQLLQGPFRVEYLRPRVNREKRETYRVVKVQDLRSSLVMQQLRP